MKSLILKAAVEAIKIANASTLLRQAQGSARTVFDVLTQLVNRPFALSSLRSRRVEGLVAGSLLNVG